MEVQQPWHVGGVDPAHPAFGADAPVASARGEVDQGGVDVLDLLGGRARRLLIRAVGDQREVKLGLGSRPQPSEGFEVGAVVAPWGTVNETKFSERCVVPVTALTRSTCICNDSGCLKCWWP